MNGVLLVSALLMGLLGGTHCVVMCGGVVAMTCSALPPDRRTRPLAQLPYLLAYNAGRIGSYAVAGAASGALGATLASFGAVGRIQLGLRLVAALLMLAVGLYVSGFTRALRWVERGGEPLWRTLAPFARRLLPVRSPAHAFALGLLWGWMPCGLVYASLAASLTSGSPIAGAATMAAFGAGTLPVLLTMGWLAGLTARAARMRTVRAAAGAVIVVFGVVQLAHVGRAWMQEGGSGPTTCCAQHAHG